MDSWKRFWNSSGKLLMSLVFVAATLPVLLIVVADKQGIRLFTKADEKAGIRIWVEPPEIVTKVGNTLTFKVMAEYGDKNQLIPSLSGKLKIAEGLTADKAEINYKLPISGKTEVGEVSVTTGKEGSFTLGIDQESVKTGLANIPVSIAWSVIIVRK